MPHFTLRLLCGLVAFAASAADTSAENKILQATGDPVPGAGEASTGIPADAIWREFGAPAINDAGQVAFLGHWKPFSNPGSGIFVGGSLVVKVGDSVPGLAGATFKRLYDPVLDNAGHVVFLASIEGTGITAVNDQVIVSNGRAGTIEVLARTGAFAPGTNGATFNFLDCVSIRDGSASGTPPTTGSASGVIFLASLNRGTGSPATTLANDTGAWWLPAGGTEVLKLVREGDVGFAPRERVRTFRILKTIDASPGHGRGLVVGDEVLLQLGMNTGRHALAAAQPAAMTRLAVTGSNLGSTAIPGAVWYKLGLPSSGSFGADVSVFGTLRERVGGVPRAATRGIFVSANGGLAWEPLARSAGLAVGVPNARFTILHEPVNSSTGSGVAFLGTVRGRGILVTDNDGLWWRPDDGTLTLLAREGAQPPDAPIGAKWRVFNSIALPGGSSGPVFTATLQTGAGGITTATDFGLYTADAAGAIRQLVREGQPLLGGTVKSFTILRAIVGIEGTSRAFNNTGSVALLVTFADGTKTVVQLEVAPPPL